MNDRIEKIEKILTEKLLYKKVVSFNTDTLYLEDGQKVILTETDHDCCAVANGYWDNFNIIPEALITSVKLEEIELDDGYEAHAKLVLYYENQKIIEGNLSADAGNSGYYGSTLGVYINEDFLIDLITESGVA